MAIPDFQSIMLPLLKYLKDQKEQSSKDIKDHICKEFKLTQKDLEAKLPSSSSISLISNRVAWAEAHMKMAGIIESPRRGFYKITNEGLNVLKNPPEKINIKFLATFEPYKRKREDWQNKEKEENNSVNENDEVNSLTPDEMLEIGYKKIKNELSIELLNKIKECSPKFFESLVVELLIKMGYGGSLEERGSITGKVGDEGIDGVIKEDKLGLDIIYIQAKKWEGNIGRPEIQKFVGALQGQRAKKGIFITTSSFNENSYDYVSKIDIKVVLINGEELANLMIDYNVGVASKRSFEIKKIDTDYFIEE
ncbi:MAG TPA: restriction endonuclease [Leptospiraceae bacterium]|nr:restriction endonuclease [Leptospiraceae bacterium]HMW06172.1 restriction endonuclease [Leptospiraceae bacterium]HMX30700.1 restriction endonuclease [Leptospiraceae bacterium]HMY31833.1 restriction endonuclease [Leptospiraceae bacterium]HMZ64949.1 restriction endonuclease [Leptospiraceae bacterium]